MLRGSPVAKVRFAVANQRLRRGRDGKTGVVNRGVANWCLLREIAVATVFATVGASAARRRDKYPKRCEIAIFATALAVANIARQKSPKTVCYGRCRSKLLAPKFHMGVCYGICRSQRVSAKISHEGLLRLLPKQNLAAKIAPNSPANFNFILYTSATARLRRQVPKQIIC